jgi:hypothetical protein
MGKVQKKKVTYVVGVTLDGPIYCDHDVIEPSEANGHGADQQETKGVRMAQRKAHYSNPHSEKRTCGHSQKSVRESHKK